MLNWLRLSGSLAADEACDVSLRILCRCLAPLASNNRCAEATLCCVSLLSFTGI